MRNVTTFARTGLFRCGIAEVMRIIRVPNPCMSLVLGNVHPWQPTLVRRATYAIRSQDAVFRRHPRTAAAEQKKEAAAQKKEAAAQKKQLQAVTGPPPYW
eukprot:COSAG02_NODE_2397_length_8951_cov_3.254406_1_plen_99_part_10